MLGRLAARVPGVTSVTATAALGLRRHDAQRQADAGEHGRLTARLRVNPQPDPGFDGRRRTGLSPRLLAKTRLRRHSMASYPASSRPPVETESGAFFKVAAMLLGLAVAAVGFFALMMWADAREARDTTPAPAAPRPPRTTTRPITTSPLPLSSFAGVVPENAAELAAAHKPYDATLPALTPATSSRCTWSSRTSPSRSPPASSTTPGRSTATARPVRSSTSARGRRSR